MHLTPTGAVHDGRVIERVADNEVSFAHLEETRGHSSGRGCRRRLQNKAPLTKAGMVALLVAKPMLNTMASSFPRNCGKRHAGKHSIGRATKNTSAQRERECD